MLHMRDICVHVKTGTCTGSLIDDDDRLSGGEGGERGFAFKTYYLVNLKVCESKI